LKPQARRHAPPKRAGAAGPPPGLAIRQAAHRLILGVIERHRPLEEEFGALAGNFSPRDRAFIRRLATTSLRRFGQAEALIGGLLDKGPLPAKQTGLRTLLAMGACELIYLATPPHAVIDTAVRLAQANPQLAGQSGLVNALLRRLSREVTDVAAADQRAPVTLNTPAWLAERWRRHYGAAAADAFARAHAEEPPLDFTVKSDPAHWAKALDATLLPTGSLRRATGGQIGDLPGYQDGAWWIQDAAAALPARLLGDVAGKAMLDLCAAPGGKTAQLAASGATVTALDRDAGRLARLETNLRRLGLSARFECADAMSYAPPAPFSHILLDAPCSATGTLRRHPDLPWLKRDSDVAQSAEAQSQLLDAATRMLAPGGVLVYVVCSLEPEEGEAQIEAFLSRQKELRVVPLAVDELAGAREFVTPQGYLRTTPAAWPELGGLDGFFAARLKRA
jgi:16S rRNA (cytosine967-C5)-methyltransferase